MTPGGALTTLYNFCPVSGCADGRTPLAGLVQATNGDLYGTTEFGGANSCIFDATDYGCGTVFKITPSGTLTTIYSFCSQAACADGESPYAGLVQGTNGYLYGTTYEGGANGVYGTIFKITPTGTLTTLYSFCSLSGCADGSAPQAGLVLATNGNLYGTTTAGGTSPFGDGAGTVYQITPAGALTTIYSFCPDSGCLDGEDPIAGAHPGYQWESLWDNVARRRRRCGDHLQCHDGWRAEYAIQLLLHSGLRRWFKPTGAAGAGHQWGVLRDRKYRRRRQLGHGL